MSPSVEISPATFTRLQSHAVPLVDTIESVINRMVDAFEANDGKPTANSDEASAGAGVRPFNPNTPPNLTHAKMLGVSLCGKPLGRGADNWNGLLNAAVREAKKMARNPDEFKELMVVPFVDGVKNDEGFRHFSDLNISVQGQDANGAWRAACHIAQKLGLPLSAKFAWREKEGAAFPGTIGQFTINGK